jgi:hypothetical protein
VAAHTRQGRRRALARSARLAADLGSPVRPMLAHILAWASTRPISTIEILDWVDPLSVSPRSATHRHCRRWLSAVLPQRIGSQSLRLSEALVGISREWEPRGRLANGNCNHSNLTQSPSRQGRWASALRPMLIGTMGGRFRAKGGSPFACLPSLIGVASER